MHGACVLIHLYEQDIDFKNVKILHPIIYMSGLFHGSQM